MRILDVGSGTSSILELLGDVQYTGVEPNEKYVNAAQLRWGVRATFIPGNVEDTLKAIDSSFDVILASGVLHHLSDSDVRTFFTFAACHLEPLGTVVTIDPGFVPKQSPLSRFMVARDRGRHVRSMHEYARFGWDAGLQVRAFWSNGMLRIPYSHVTLLCSKG
jgi:2-polyprenyl-3-methyl-5-hydroxy-6-metoxy-1,4-benzoquinol methylase